MTLACVAAAVQGWTATPLLLQHSTGADLSARRVAVPLNCCWAVCLHLKLWPLPAPEVGPTRWPGGGAGFGWRDARAAFESAMRQENRVERMVARSDPAAAEKRLQQRLLVAKLEAVAFKGCAGGWGRRPQAGKPQLPALNHPALLQHHPAFPACGPAHLPCPCSLPSVCSRQLAV